ncbi:MAG: uridine kinase [Balneolaceae bacterium]|nr:uridine kinase [Balneolaceae bacterium]
MNPVIIGVAGGTAAGKTTVIRHITDQIGQDNMTVLEHDSYYRDLNHLSFEEREQQNFDHPSALETELMVSHIEKLKDNKSVEVPIYDFSRHIRKEETQSVAPKKVILVDGILIFSELELRELMDIKIYVDTDDDIRLVRRIRRDIQERDRSLEGILNRYVKYVRPMHLEFVEPSKRYADIIIPRGGENEVALEMVNALISERLSNGQ